MSILEEKEREINKLKKLLDLQKRSETRSKASTPQKLFMKEDENKSDASLTAQKVMPNVQLTALSVEVPVIDYEHKYKALLINLELHEDALEESIIHHIETLLTMNARYGKSVQDLMQKIDWMEQNLNLISQ
jgi:hypothetical protein